MKIFRKERLPNGRRHVYFCGVKILSYKKDKKTDINDGNCVDILRRMGVKIGDDCRVWGMPILGTEPYFIEIGEGTTVSGCVTFLTHDGSLNACQSYYPNWNRKIQVPLGRIKIGKRCFIGIHAIILPGITIGDDCVVGAGSVVTKNIPSGEVWGGNPARFIKKTKQLSKKYETFLQSPEQKELQNLKIKFDS